MTRNERNFKNWIVRNFMVASIIVCVIGVFVYAFFDAPAIGKIGISLAAGTGISDKILDWIL